MAYLTKTAALRMHGNFTDHRGLCQRRRLWPGRPGCPRPDSTPLRIPTDRLSMREVTSGVARYVLLSYGGLMIPRWLRRHGLAALHDADADIRHRDPGVQNALPGH